MEPVKKKPIQNATLAIRILLLFGMVTTIVGGTTLVNKLLEKRLQTSSRADSTANLISYGILNVKSPPSSLPAAKGDGVTDDTDALQTLINYAYNNSMVPLFPEGTYIVSKTLHMDQNAYKADRHYRAHQLIGSTKGQRPVIRLKPNAAGFTQDPLNANGTVSLSKIAYVLDYRSTCDPQDVSAGAPACQTDFEGARSVNFNNGIRNIEVQIGSGNRGAVALNFPASQYSFIEDISLIVGDGFAGMANVPGLGAVTGNMYIEGGYYGIYNGAGVAYTNNTTYTNITLKDQRLCAIFEPLSEKPTQFVGFTIEKDTGPVFCGRMSGGSNVSLVDGTIEFRNGASENIAIINAGQKSMAIYNVYIKNAKNYYQYGQNKYSFSNYQPNIWYQLSEIFSNDSDSTKPALIDGSIKSAPNPKFGPIGRINPPANLAARHSWGQPDWSPDQLVEYAQIPATTKVCNAKNDPGILGNGVHDDYAALQAMVNNPNCKIVFLPRGRYYITDTLTLPDGVTLTGITPRLAEIVPIPAAYDPAKAKNAQNTTSFPWKATSRTPVVTTVNDANAQISMRNIRFWLPTSPKSQSNFVAFDWRAGKKSMLKNVITRPMFGNEVGATAKPDILFSENAGGRWWGANSISVSETAAVAQHRRLLVENIHGPLAFYNYNIEDGWASHVDMVNGWQSEVINSQNIAIYGGKFEDDNGIRFVNSNNIVVFGLTNTEMQMEWSNGYSGGKNTLWAVLNSKLNPTRGSFTEKNADSSVKIVLDTILNLYTRGTVDYSVFDFSSNIIPTDTFVPTHTMTPTLTPIVDPTQTITPIVSGPIPDVCPNFQNGNANCDTAGVVDLLDYLCWVREYTTGVLLTGCISADFDAAGGVTLLDYVIWYRGYSASN